MFKNTSLESVTQPMLNNLKAWGDLVSKQAQAAQAAVAANIETFKAIKEPQATLEVMRGVASNAIAMATQHVKEASALSVAQLNASIESLEKSHPAPEAFAPMAKSMKDAVAAMEKALASTINTSATSINGVTDVYPKTTPKKTTTA